MTRLVCEELFGGCPQCGEALWANLGRTHWCYCPDHRVRWWVGENILSSWRNENEEIWAQNKVMLTAFREVEPIEEGEQVPMAIEAEALVNAMLIRIGAK